MDLEYITKLIELISHSKVDEIEIEEDGKKIRITKTQSIPPASQQAVYSATPTSISSPSTAHAMGQTALAQSVSETSGDSKAKLHEIRSPIVGTFYRAPVPDAPAFVEVGTMISKGSVLCIVEAMKLMNEIESDIAGKVVQLMVENGDPVEYDQVLFLVEPA